MRQGLMIVMLAASLATVGGCFLNANGLGGTDADGDADGDGDGDADGDGDGDADADTDADADADTDADADADVDGDTDADADADTDADGDVDDGCAAVDCNDRIACTEDLCEAGVCDNRADDSACAPDERCIPEVGCAGVIWVDQACNPCGEGTSGSPFPTIEEAFGVLDAPVENRVIKVRSGEYDEGTLSYSDPGTPLVVAGNPGVFWTSSAHEVLTVSGGARVVLHQLKMRGGHRALVCDESECVLDQIEIVDCSREALKAVGSAVVELNRSLIQRNTKSGLRAEATATLKAYNTMILQNGVSDGDAGGIYLKDPGTSLVAINCTIADNVHADRAAAVYAPGGAASLMLTNLLLWNNSTDSEGEECDGCAGALWNSLVGEDPLFSKRTERVDVDDYQITAFSPARNKGVTPEGFPRIDYFGAPRDDGRLDLGADEYHPATTRR